MTPPALSLALDDRRWIDAAIALAQRGVGQTSPNPAVGCILVKQGRVVGRGWTQPGGRPHAEAVAIAAAGPQARGATAYVSLEPCAHESTRGGCCADALTDAGVARVVMAMVDPDPRTASSGMAKLSAAGVETALAATVQAKHAARAIAPWLSRMRHARPFVTLKLATSLDGCIAAADSKSRWITGERARAHGHLERARHNAILVGRGTFAADAPQLDVRLPGLEARSPRRLLLTHGKAETRDGWTIVNSVDAVDEIDGIASLLVEGGAQTAAAFLRADRVDRLLIYRAPILIGGGRSALTDIGLANLADAHARWAQCDTRMLGNDRLDVYERVRED